MYKMKPIKHIDIALSLLKERGMKDSMIWDQLIACRDELRTSYNAEFICFFGRIIRIDSFIGYCQLIFMYGAILFVIILVTYAIITGNYTIGGCC